MKVYGYDITGPVQGELIAAKVDSFDLYFGMEMLAGHLGWEFASTSFAEAKKTLIKEMRSGAEDPELVSVVRGYKASMIPVMSGSLEVE